MSISAGQRERALKLLAVIADRWNLDHGVPPRLPGALGYLEEAVAAGDPEAFDTALRRISLARPVRADGSLPEDSGAGSKEEVLIALARLEEALAAPPPPPPPPAAGAGAGAGAGTS